jgi:hypothetical protein
MTSAADGADLDAIWAALEKDRVYVHPQMADKVTAQQLTEVKDTVAGSPVPTYVVVYPLHPDDEFNGDPADLAATLHDHRAEPGIYLATDVRWDRIELGGASWDVRSESSDAVGHATFAAKVEHPGDLGAQMVAATQMIAEGTTEARYDTAWEKWEKEQEKLESDSDSSSGSSSQGSSSSSQISSASGDDSDAGAIVGISLTVAIAAVAVALAVAWRRFKAERGEGPGRQKAFTLPASVVERVRDAHDSALVARADREILAFGEAIDAAHLSGDTAAWQAALDHYDAAKRVRGDSTRPDVLDVVGALVLSERGREALACAIAGKPYQPTTPCYLNPLHGAATGRTALTTPRGKVVVPLCVTCRRDLSAHRRPDILDVVRGDGPVHYFDSGVEPWASTGYGALEPDLITTLHRTRR